jgi:hypothetical protein
MRSIEGGHVNSRVICHAEASRDILTVESHLPEFLGVLGVKMARALPNLSAQYRLIGRIFFQTGI